MTLNLSIDHLLENFAAFEDWEGRYQYLIELGKLLLPMAEADKTEETKVRGCISQVWIKPKWRHDGRFDFDGDSDAMIVKGLVAILKIAYAGKTSDEIAQLDIQALFTKLGLDQHLSPNRRNGFYAMVERIKNMKNI